MRAEVGCEPHVVVAVVLGVALGLSLLSVDVDGWGCSVGHCAFWNSYVVKAYCAGFACDVER